MELGSASNMSLSCSSPQPSSPDSSHRGTESSQNKIGVSMPDLRILSFLFHRTTARPVPVSTRRVTGTAKTEQPWALGRYLYQRVDFEVPMELHLGLASAVDVSRHTTPLAVQSVQHWMRFCLT